MPGLLLNVAKPFNYILCVSPLVSSGAFEACPLQNKCMNKDIVYKATISTSNTFKERYKNNIKYFTYKKYSNETELSKHIWHLKQNKTDFAIKWSIIKKLFLTREDLKDLIYVWRKNLIF